MAERIRHANDITAAIELRNHLPVAHYSLQLFLLRTKSSLPIFAFGYETQCALVRLHCNHAGQSRTRCSTRRLHRGAARVSLHRGETKWLQRKDARLPRRVDARQRRRADARPQRRAARSADSFASLHETRKPAFEPAFLFLSRVPSVRQLDDLGDQRRILDSCLLRRARELALLFEVAVGVRLDHVNFFLRRDA